MKSGDRNTEKAPELRRRAEELFLKKKAQSAENLEALSVEHIRRMLHELEVNQIELEIQNEELRRAQEGLKDARARYFDLYDMAPIGYCTLSEDGLILEANLTAADLLGVARGTLLKKPISRFICKDDQDIYFLRHKSLLKTGTPQAFELRMVKKDQTVIWARLNASATPNSTGAPVFRLVLSDITEHKQALEALQESELRESEDRFRKLFKQHSAVMLVLDAETGDIIDASAAAVRFYGWSLEELKQMNIQEINTLPPEAVQASMAKAALSMSTRSEFRHRRADGSIRDVEVFSNKIEGAFRNFLFSIIHDITERKHAEEALREEERYLRTILQTTVDGFWVVDVEGKIIEVNQAYCRMSGYSRDELLKLDISTIDAIEAPAITSARIQRIVANESEIFETRHRRKDGSVFQVEISASYMNTGEGKIVCFSRDITERKHAEVMLKKEQEELQIIMDSSPIMIFYKDCENRFIRINTKLAEVSGLAKEAMEGRLVSEIFPNQAKDYWQDDKEVIASGKPKIGIVEPIDATAGPRWVQTDKIPYRDKNGRIVGIIGFSVDITDRKQAEEQLQSINSELERRVEQRTRELQETQLQYLHAEKLSAIGKLSASVAHEFNNPLQGIMAILKGLKKRAILADEDRELLDAAIDESIRMRNLIRSLQDFNRPSSDKKMPIDVHKSLDSLLLLCKSDFKGKRISVVLDYAESLPQILAVPDQIKQVFLNLLTNAADACLKAGGEITISTRREVNRVAVAIKDTGVGISPENMGLIFQPFYTTKPEVKGIGLGLSVCHGIIQNHRGEIRVESRPSEGATFTVLLPISQESDVVS